MPDVTQPCEHCLARDRELEDAHALVVGLRIELEAERAAKRYTGPFGTLSREAALARAEFLSTWLFTVEALLGQVPPQALELIEGEVRRLRGVRGEREPSSVALALFNALEEIDRLRAVVDDRDATLARFLSAAPKPSQETDP